MINVKISKAYMLNKYQYSVENFTKDIINMYNGALNHLHLVGDFTVGISFVGEQKIRDLNNQYRQVDRVTDVLSFPLVQDFNNLEDEKDENGIVDLGDIVINVKRASSQAKQYNHGIRREICFLCLHGLLHLLGYDHIEKEDEKVMFKLQNDILNKFDIKR